MENFAEKPAGNFPEIRQTELKTNFKSALQNLGIKRRRPEGPEDPVQKQVCVAWVKRRWQTTHLINFHQKDLLTT